RPAGPESQPLSLATSLRRGGLPNYEAALHRKLRRGQLERTTRDRLRHALELEHHATGLHDCHPLLRIALPLPHPGLRRLLRDRLVREDADPDLTATPDVARHRDTGRFDLPVRDPP